MKFHGKTALQKAIGWNQHEVVNAWELIKREATAAKEERARQVMIVHHGRP
jgi:hypothetical protein